MACSEAIVRKCGTAKRATEHSSGETPSKLPKCHGGDKSTARKNLFFLAPENADPATSASSDSNEAHPTCRTLDDIMDVGEQDFDGGASKKFKVNMDSYQSMGEKTSPTEFPIKSVRKWAQYLRFQQSITAKLCSPVKAQHKKRLKNPYSVPGIKEKNWEFHVVFSVVKNVIKETSTKKAAQPSSWNMHDSSTGMSLTSGGDWKTRSRGRLRWWRRPQLIIVWKVSLHF